jgi:glutamate---cysteine ligase / carboxylate-amine ligase
MSSSTSLVRAELPVVDAEFVIHPAALMAAESSLTMPMPSMVFTTSAPLTMGVELELQLINVETQNLTTEADDLLRRLQKQPVAPHLKPEITQSMIEINSGVHARIDTLQPEMLMIRDALVTEAKRMNIGICGGGNHPFQRWNDRRIYPTDRFLAVAEKYGYLAKQFTVFGQHIHIGVESGDDAMYLTHSFSKYVPHFVALAASSPFYQDADTSFDSSRLSIVNAFPLAGHAPEVLRWDEFLNYFDKMFAAGAIASMKDFYWDIRPKPEFGTVELRICDTPLTVELACDLAAYAQTLAAWLLNDREHGASVYNISDLYLPYAINRFEACRYGLHAELIHAERVDGGINRMLGEEIMMTIQHLKPYAQTLGTEEALQRLSQMVFTNQNGARWLRERFRETDSMWDVVAAARRDEKGNTSKYERCGAKSAESTRW